MATITLPNTFTAGTVILSAQVNSNFTTIYNDYNGGITNANLAAGAAIADTKLATLSTAGKVNLSALTIASQAQGDITYASSATVWTRLGAGTSGQALTTGGASANPAWAGMTTQGDVEYMSATTRSRLAPGTSGQALTTGGASANPAWAGMTTQGDVEYMSATTRTRLGPGTSGQILKTGGAGANPSWTDIGSATLTTNGANTTVFSTTAPTANRTVTIPNANVNLTIQVIKGWVNFNGTGVIAINDNFNVTSLTDNGVGDWTVNWTTAFANANYACVVSVGGSASSGWARLDVGATPLATGSARVNGRDSSGAAYDSAVVCVIAIGQ